MERVCVTGASGFIASWIVKLLLERGYTVNATVRNLKDLSKIEYLVCFDGAKERLHLFEANLMEEGSFDSAIQGCDGVFHVASPVILDSPNPQEDVIDPAVKGTLNVLNSCAKVPSIKRVIFSSSTAAVLWNGRPLTHETVVDETWFSTPEGCEATGYGKWYLLSKLMAEEAAWKFANEKGIDMVSINPACVVGPFFQPSLNYVASVVLSLITGVGTFPNSVFGWVHVKDVAEAHIRAFEIPLANGRYIISETVAYISEIANILGELYPTLKISNRWDDNPKSFKYSSEKAKSLGINYIPLRVGLKDTVECLKEKKFINI